MAVIAVLYILNTNKLVILLWTDVKEKAMLHISSKSEYSNKKHEQDEIIL